MDTKTTARRETRWATMIGLIGAFVFAPYLAADEFVVTSSSPTGPGSLSEAIVNAFFSDGEDTITFDPSVTTILIESSIQDVNAADPVTIDGGGTVTLVGTGASEGTNGLQLTTFGHTVRGLTIKNFDGDQIVAGGFANIIDCTITGGGEDGIQVLGAGVEIRGCLIGTDGVNDLGNARNGIDLNIVTSAFIGGSTEQARNVVSGNGRYGIEMRDSGSILEIRGNYIGTNAAGTAAIGNDLGGIRISDSPSLSIGGSGSGEGNLISGNAGSGIEISGSTSSGIVIYGNLIGTDATGLLEIGNAFSGIAMTSAGSGFIGGPGENERNVICANGVSGIQIMGMDSSITDIQNNYIGVGIDGTTAMGNDFDGVSIINSESILIGGLDENEGNIIAGNGKAGIFVSDAQECLIFGNRIGAGANDEAMGNGENGIALQTQSNRTQIGNGTAPNIVANNVGAGILITGSVENTISRNSIYGNTGDGIALATANDFISAPVVTQLGSVRGTAEALGTVEIFVDDAEEGRTWIASTQADDQGTFYSPIDLTPFQGMNVTATVTDGSGNTSAFSSPVLIENLGEATHAADQDADNAINLSELLRVIQFFNSARYGCEDGTEDGYNPNDNDTECTPHTSDYAPQDWIISLSELLRLIQFFNSGGYYFCPDADPPTEDGFCPGVE